MALGGSGNVERLSNADSAEEDAEGLYGLIEPFTLAGRFRGEPVIQIFDRGVLDFRDLPNTMMTNAGERTWAVEFRPRDVIEALGNPN